jgi:hypothetical protein
VGARRQLRRGLFGADAGAVAFDESPQPVAFLAGAGGVGEVGGGPVHLGDGRQLGGGDEVEWAAGLVPPSGVGDEGGWAPGLWEGGGDGGAGCGEVLGPGILLPVMAYRRDTGAVAWRWPPPGQDSVCAMSRATGAGVGLLAHGRHS